MRVKNSVMTVTTFKIGDLLPSTTQATANGIQLGGCLLEASIDMFIELEDQLIKVGDVQGPFNLQVTKVIFKSQGFGISERLNPCDGPEYLVFKDTGGKNAFIQGLHGDYIVIF